MLRITLIALAVFVVVWLASLVIRVERADGSARACAAMVGAPCQKKLQRYTVIGGGVAAPYQHTLRRREP